MLKFNQYLEEKFGDICPQCMQDPCVCGGNHIAKENQLDEITMKALQSYRQKAHTQIQHYKYGSGKDKPEASKVLAKREPGMAKATDKVIKKDKERIAAQPKPTPQKSEPYKPLGGRDEKSGRSYSEETEQIDELSRDTLLSYANKVSLDSQKHSKDPSRRSAEKANRSVAGYAKAHNRLEKPVKESEESDKHYKEAEDHLSKANDADAKGDKKSFHAHMANHHDSMSEWHDSKGRSASADKHAEKADYHHEKSLSEETISELSTELLARYKNKAGEDASKQDKAGNFEKGHKRFKGIMKATFKQFANDAKK
jgi:hypothetical protein